MATPKQIKAWLSKSDSDYAAGVEMLSALCKNKFLVNQLARKDSPANRKKLAYELSKLSGLESTAATPKKKRLSPLFQMLKALVDWILDKQAQIIQARWKD